MAKGKCKFCEGGRPERSFNKTGAVKFELSDVEGKDVKCITVRVDGVNHTAFAEMEARYCPKCGREL